MFDLKWVLGYLENICCLCLFNSIYIFQNNDLEINLFIINAGLSIEWSNF